MTTPITPEAEFATLYGAHRTRIENYIVTRLPRPDRHLAEDLTAEAFTSLWRSLQAGRAVDHPLALLRTIAARRVYDHYRLARNVRELASDTGDWSFANRDLQSTGGYYTPAATGFRTASIGGAK